jgi:hypothetical protein
MEHAAMIDGPHAVIALGVAIMVIGMIWQIIRWYH